MLSYEMTMMAFTRVFLFFCGSSTVELLLLVLIESFSLGPSCLCDDFGIQEAKVSQLLFILVLLSCDTLASNVQ